MLVSDLRGSLMILEPTFLCNRFLFWRLVEWNQPVMDNVMTLSVKEQQNVRRMSLMAPKELSFLRRCCRCWHLLRISSVLMENFSCQSKMVPRYLCSSTSSTGSPWIVVVAAAAASSLCLFEKVTTISLVLLTFSSEETVKKSIWCVNDQIPPRRTRVHWEH